MRLRARNQLVGEGGGVVYIQCTPRCSGYTGSSGTVPERSDIVLDAGGCGGTANGGGAAVFICLFLVVFF